VLDTSVPDDWTPRLAATVAAAVREFAPALRGTPLVVLAIDCHPWHGSVGLSVLTAAEVAADGLLAEPVEEVAWRHYNLTARITSWEPATRLVHRHY
jgi:hypothetical protein